jgi:molybdate transport system substrate-binding protein
VRSRTLSIAGGFLALALVGAACGSDSSSSNAVTVFAASSLTDAFTELGDAFTQANPDADLTFSFASSSDLARQVIEGAPGDVYASADLANMAKVTDAGAVAGEPTVFATNSAEIIVGPGNPLGITGLGDLATRDLVVVVCAPEVPCGTYAAEIFDRAGVTVTPDSLEDNVKAVVTKVTLGEADAGVVYVTDVEAAGEAASGVEIPADVNVVADYPIVAVSDNPVARAFIDFVMSTAGQDILASYRFAPPR